MAIYTYLGELTKVRGGGSARGIRPSSQRSEPVGNGGRERERGGGDANRTGTVRRYLLSRESAGKKRCRAGEEAERRSEKGHSQKGDGNRFWELTRRRELEFDIRRKKRGRTKEIYSRPPKSRLSSPNNWAIQTGLECLYNFRSNSYLIDSPQPKNHQVSKPGRKNDIVDSKTFRSL